MFTASRSRVPRVVILTWLVLAGCALGAPLASAGTRILGLHGWQVQSTANIGAGGARISEPTYDAGGWLQVKPDGAGAVGTEVEALVQNHRCPNVFYAQNMDV